MIGAILKDDPPPISSLQPMTPPALDRVVKRCLAKDRDDRWQSARDVCEELKWIAEGGSLVSSLPTASARGIHVLGRPALVFSLGALLLGALIATLAVWNLKPSPLPQPVSRLVITLPPAQQLAGLDSGPVVALSPDGTHLAYVARQGGTQQLYLRAMDSLEARPIPDTVGAVNPFFSPDGQWLGFFAGTELKKVLVSGGAALTLGDAGITPAGASWSKQGTIIFAPTLVGVLQQVPEAGGTPRPLFTFGGNLNQNAAWTPDGKRMAFQSNKEGSANLFWQLADGGGGLERLRTSEYTDSPVSWSPDGRSLAFTEINPTTGYDIWVLRLSDRKAEPFLRTPFNESVPQFSPDGRWLAYISDESGRFEIYVQPYPGPGGKWQISTEGGMEPVWNPNGRELFYRSGAKMMAVEVTTQPNFAAGKPRVLFEGPYLPTPATFPNYDVSADGQRFLMLKANEQAQAPTQINVVLNWFEELKRRVPVGNE